MYNARSSWSEGWKGSYNEIFEDLNKCECCDFKKITETNAVFFSWNIKFFTCFFFYPLYFRLKNKVTGGIYQ